MPSPLLSAIFIYPVKSLAGIKVDSWEIISKGLLYDRQWMIIDRENRFLSQRQIPRMCLIHTAINEEYLTLSTASQNSISIPLDATSDERVESKIWQDQCSTQLVSKEADLWLSEFLQQDCRLVRQTEQKRLVDQKYATPNDHVAFTDGFPFLITCESSLTELNQQMQHHISMTRFRPNLVISGYPSFAEDNWRQISIGDIKFRLPKPCSRCSVTTINPDTAETSKEPLSTLNKLRKWNGKVYFGQNALHDNLGKINVGDAVKIQQTGEQQPPLKNLFANLK